MVLQISSGSLPSLVHLTFLALFSHHHVVIFADALSAEYRSLASIGAASSSSDTPRRIAVTASGHIFVSGTTTPFERTTESSLGTPLHSGLLADDVFVARLSNKTSGEVPASSIFRLGSSREDNMHALLVSEDNAPGRDTISVYIAGSCGGSFPNSTHRGQIDAFLVKLTFPLSDPSASPRFSWPQPAIFGTSGSEAVNTMAFDPTNPDIIFAAGYTTGNLFTEAGASEKAVEADSFLVAISTSTGAIISQRQFGSQSDPDYAADIYVSPDSSGPVFVSVLTEKQHDNFRFGNFHLYKFSRSLEPLGDVLLQSYSRESLAGFAAHPFLSNNLFVAGSSFLDATKGQDVFVKRIIAKFDTSNIGSNEMPIDDVTENEYTRRYGSLDHRNDYAGAMVVHEGTGRLLLGGYTEGSFIGQTDSPSSESEIANSDTSHILPFITCIDPLDGSISGTVQLHLSMLPLVSLPSPTPSSSSGNEHIELWGLVFSSEDPNILDYVLKVFNSTTGQFLSVIGEMQLPDEWRSRIFVPPTPSPSQKPVDLRLKDSGMSIGILALGVGGGVAAIVMILVLVCVVRRVKGDGKDGEKSVQRLGPQPYNPQTEITDRIEQVVAIDEVKTQRAELV